MGTKTNLTEHPCYWPNSGSLGHRSVVYSDGRQHYCERCDEKLDHDNFPNIPASYVTTHDLRELKAPDGPWKCFHCDLICETIEEATAHFGPNEECTPICKVGAERYREMERTLQLWQADAAPDGELYYRLGAAHATALREAEQKGYDKGLRDARYQEAWAILSRLESQKKVPADMLERVREFLR